MGFLVTDQTGGNFNLALSDGGTLPVQGAAGSTGTAGAAAFTPNAEQSFGPITPGGGAVVLAVADITPKASGLLSIKATVAVASSAPDALNLALFAIAPLTAITGGTPVGQGITLDPTSTTPAFGGAPIMSTLGVESTTGGDLAGATITGTFQAVAGQRTGIVLTGLSAVGGATTWVVGLTFEVIEQASGTGGSGPGTVQSVTAAAPASSGIVVTNPTTNPTLAFAPGFAPPSLAFLNNAALSAYNAAAPTALVQGQRAVVLSNGGVWTFKLVSALTVGNTVLNATGVAGAQWVRDGQTNIPNALKQTAWFVDAQNVSGTASDENDGLTSATALLNKKEIYRRWGWTWSPTLVSLNVVITYLSADNAGVNQGTDPGYFAPLLVNGATLLHTAALPAASFTGTLLAVTAKAKSTNTLLQSTFTTVTGALAVGMLLVNATRANSTAFAKRNAAGTWTLTQPLSAWTPGASGVRTPVDTWANGDSISGYVPLPIDIARIGGQNATFNAAFSPAHAAYRLTLIDAGLVGLGLSILVVEGSAFPGLIDVVMSRPPQVDLTTGVLSGVFFLPSAGGYIDAKGGNGSVQGGFTIGDMRCTFLNDAIVKGTIHDCDQAANSIAVDTGDILIERNRVSFTNGGGFYGGGTLNVFGILALTGTAVAGLPIATLQINSKTTAYGWLTAAGATTLFNRALSAAALDAASGLATGFAGYATGGGAAISIAGAQP